MSVATRTASLPRTAWTDAPLIAASGVHAAALLLAPSLPVVAIGLWWNANTVAHNFIHNPFFRSKTARSAFSIYLSLLMGVPQTLWRERHLAHHANRAARIRPSPQLCAESAAVAGLWITLALVAPSFFAFAYLPGYFAGLMLCTLQGRYEHRADETVDHRGALYNLLFFNDGHHAAHHRSPKRHWRDLPRAARVDTPTSRYPAVLRWLEAHPLDLLERLALGSKLVRRWVLSTHERALAKLLPAMGDARRVAIVGGALFPRSALLLSKHLPDAELTVIDQAPLHIETARARLPSNVRVVSETYDPARHDGFDLVVIPLAYQGDREALYRDPPAETLLVHDWLPRRRGIGALVSLLLFKRMNLIRRAA